MRVWAYNGHGGLFAKIAMKMLISVLGRMINEELNKNRVIAIGDNKKRSRINSNFPRMKPSHPYMLSLHFRKIPRKNWSA